MLNWQLLRAESHKIWRWYIPVLALIVIYVLLRPDPVGPEDWRMSLLASLLGLTLAWRVLYDPSGTQSFLWSRPMTRGQLFLHRWALGAFLLFLTGIVIALIIVSGARVATQIYLGPNPFYPGVYIRDLNILFSFFTYSFIVYHIVLYLKLYAELFWGKTDSVYGGVLRAIVFAVVSIGTPQMLYFASGIYFTSSLFLFVRWWVWARVFGVIVIGALLAGMSIFIYRNLEVES